MNERLIWETDMREEGEKTEITGWKMRCVSERRMEEEDKDDDEKKEGKHRRLRERKNKERNIKKATCNTT